MPLSRPADKAESSLVASVPLDKHFEFQITNLKSDYAHIRELMDKDAELVATKEGLTQRALELQFKEYERRLEALNHEAQRLALMVPREMFQEVVETVRKDINKNSDILIALQLWKSNMEGRAARSQLLAVLSIVVAMGALILRFFGK